MTQNRHNRQGLTSHNGHGSLGRPGKSIKNADVTAALENISAAKHIRGQVHKNPEGVSATIEVITMDGKKLTIDVDLFEAAYKGFVKCWPVVTKVRAQYHQLRRQHEIALQRAGAVA